MQYREDLFDLVSRAARAPKVPLRPVPGGDAGTRGHGDAERQGHGDAGTRGLGDGPHRIAASPGLRVSPSACPVTPECQGCGCQHFVRVETRSPFGRGRDTLICRNCGRRLRLPVFSKQREAAGAAAGAGEASDPPCEISFRTAMRCPGCATIGRVTTTRADDGFRWWKCPACGDTWKEFGEKV